MLGAETKSMATHAPTQHDYSPPCDAAPGTPTGHAIAAGLTLWNPLIVTGSVTLPDLSGAQNVHVLMQGATLKTRTASDTRALVLRADATWLPNVAPGPLATQGPNHRPLSLIDPVLVPFMRLPVR